MCLGLGLLYLSQKEHAARIVESARAGRVLDSCGDVIKKQTAITWPRTVGGMFFVALIMTPVLGILYSLAYKGAPPVVARLSPPAPPICKTADCWPRPLNSAKPSISVTQTGTTNVNQIGNNNRATINPKTVQSVVMHVSTVCELKDQAHPPDPEMGFVEATPTRALLTGSGGTLALIAESPYLTKLLGNGRFQVINNFALAQSSDAIGQPISSLSAIKTISVQMVSLGLSNWCSAVHGIWASLSVSGVVILDNSGTLDGSLLAGQSPHWEFNVNDWQRRLDLLSASDH
jgi:hypothetical protein